MSDATAPCFSCGQPQRVSARHCSGCGGLLLVKVRLERPPAADRAAALARDLAALERFDLPRSLEDALNAPGQILLENATREEAAALMASIARNGGWTSVRSLALARRRLRRAGVLTALGLLVIAGSATAWKAARDYRAALPPGLEESALRSIVTLHCAASLGSGFFVAPDRVVTNAHVLCGEGATPTVELNDGRRVPSKLAGEDPLRDLAVLSVDGAGVAPLPLGDATTVRPGDRVLELGSPRGMGWTANQGRIVDVLAPMAGIAFLEIDIHVNPGNSGGPLLDSGGRVIGVISRKRLDEKDRALALPINHLWSTPGHEPLFALSTTSRAMEERWQQRLAAAATLDDQTAVRMVSGLKAPALIDAGQRYDQSGFFDFMVLQKDDLEREYLFTLRSERGTCRMSGLVNEWVQVDTMSESETDANEMLSWLKAKGMLGGLHIGTGRARSRGSCKRVGYSWVSIELEGRSKEFPVPETFYIED
jgi:serine protease Do